MLSAIGAWFARKAIFGGLGKVLGSIPGWAWKVLFGLLALLLAWHFHSNAEKRAAAAQYNAGFNRAFAVQQARIEQWRKANAIDAASIGRLQVALDAKNQESKDRGAALAKVQAEDVKDRATLARLAAGDAHRVGILQGLQDHAQAVPGCKAPKALTDALGGL